MVPGRAAGPPETATPTSTLQAGGDPQGGWLAHDTRRSDADVSGWEGGAVPPRPRATSPGAGGGPARRTGRVLALALAVLAPACAGGPVGVDGATSPDPAGAPG